MSERFEPIEEQMEDADVAHYFAAAESGMTPIPDEVEVDSTEEILAQTGVSLAALEQLRVSK